MTTPTPSPDGWYDLFVSYSTKDDKDQRIATSDPTNSAWQRDLSVSLEKLGDLAVAQGDLAGALRSFTEAKSITERLAASDPANVEWQRDLSVSHFKLAQFAEKQGDEALKSAELLACYGVLDGMKRRGLHFDPQMAQVFGQITSLLSGAGPGLVTSVLDPEAWNSPPQELTVDPLAKALAHLQAGRTAESLDALRPFVFAGDSLWMSPDAPFAARLGFVEALWMSGIADGVQRHLSAMPEQEDPKVKAMTQALAQWKKGFTLRQRFGKKPPLPALPRAGA